MENTSLIEDLPLVYGAGARCLDSCANCGEFYLKYLVEAKAELAAAKH
jgi:hypothetical protein